MILITILAAIFSLAIFVAGAVSILVLFTDLNELEKS